MSTKSPTEAKLRVSLWLEGPFVSKYVRDFITWSRSNTRLDLACVIISGSEAPATKPAGTALSRFLFKCLIALERAALLKNRTHRQHLQKFNVHSLVPPQVIHQWHDGATCAKIDVPDVLIAFTSKLPGKGIRETAKLGTFIVVLSDGRIYRDGPPGFWEVYFREDVTGFRIQHLTPVQDEPDTLLRGYVATQFYSLLNQASVSQRAYYYLEKMVDGVARTRAVPRPEPNLPYSYHPRGIPAARQTLSYLVGFIALAFSKLLQKCGTDYRWKIGFVHSGWRDAALWRARLIENPPGHYLADPFVITQNGRTCCFAEDYDIAQRRGRISVYELSLDTARYLGVALQENFHLSYPYLFYYEGQLYMCPETSEAKEIRLYRCVEFPLCWKFEKAIMKNVSAVDSMLFERSGKWWMLTNVDPAHWGDHSLELCLFSAESPLDDQWIPHPGNPFFIDASRARNGGLVKDGDQLFRIAQGQGFGMYGKRTIINEIIRLDVSCYAEQAISVISPTFRKGIYGTHHLHSNGSMTVFDFA